MFAGMRESEVFALWCGDIREEGIQIELSWYKGSNPFLGLHRAEPFDNITRLFEGRPGDVLVV